MSSIDSFRFKTFPGIFFNEDRPDKDSFIPVLSILRIEPIDGLISSEFSGALKSAIICHDNVRFYSTEDPLVLICRLERDRKLLKERDREWEKETWKQNIYRSKFSSRR